MKKYLVISKDKREDKYAVTCIRTLYNLISLLNTGTFSLEVPKGKQRDLLLRFKKGNYTPREVVDEAEHLMVLAREMYNSTPHKEADYKKVNDFLVKVRYKYFFGR